MPPPCALTDHRLSRRRMKLLPSSPSWSCDTEVRQRCGEGAEKVQKRCGGGAERCGGGAKAAAA
eukprot:scaffold16552_cov30-Phaeocystis_antarctica.AAC.1